MVRIAVMGATGAVGRELLRTLEQRHFPYESIRLLASERSAGTHLTFDGGRHPVRLLEDAAFDGVDIVLASAGGSVSQRFAPVAVKAGAVVIDNTSAFRMDPEVPLVVPEVNAESARLHQGIIANPNCATIQMVVALAPLHRKARIKRIIVSTYQAASGAGEAAMQEMEEQTRAQLVEGRRTHTPSKFAHPIAFNCLPHIDQFLDNGYTKEEMKMVHETRKILDDPSIQLTATCVRVPVYRCHSESINVEFERPLSPDEAREILSQAPGVKVIDDPADNAYPMAIYCTGLDDTYVGRIRADESVKYGLNLWCVSDQLRKGAALNAVQIAELIVNNGWMGGKLAAGVS
jgi:aspartate-semialdehyde dehydrogenase